LAGSKELTRRRPPRALGAGMARGA